MRKGSFIFTIALVLLGYFSIAQEVHSSFSKNKILIGEQIQLTIAAKANSANQIIWPKLKDTIIKTIEILDSVISLDDKKKEYIKKYLITSFDSGYYAIPPFKFYIDSQLVESKPLLLEVHTVEVDTTKGIKDIKEIKAETYTFIQKIKDFFQWLLDHWYVPLAILLAITAFVYYRIKNKRKNKPEEPKIILPLHEQLLLDLEALNKKQLWQSGQVKLYYVELTDLLRAHVEKRFDVMALEQTTFQLMKNIKSSGIKTDARLIIKNILESADMVKFAKAIPTDYDNEAVMENAKRFAVLTKVETEVNNA
jgi:hypothetical protein